MIHVYSIPKQITCREGREGEREVVHGSEERGGRLKHKAERREEKDQTQRYAMHTRTA